jgi:ATP/ADP translocase
MFEIKASVDRGNEEDDQVPCPFVVIVSFEAHLSGASREVVYSAWNDIVATSYSNHNDVCSSFHNFLLYATAVIIVDSV